MGDARKGRPGRRVDEEPAMIVSNEVFVTVETALRGYLEVDGWDLRQEGDGSWTAMTLAGGSLIEIPVSEMALAVVEAFNGKR